MSSTALKKGDLFLDRYQIVRRIKSGGMGAVYEVQDQHTKAFRALKLLVSRSVDEAEFLRRFELEAKITGEIESDHLVRTFDWGIDKATRTPYIVMELLRGEDLGQILRKYGALSPDKVFRHMAQAGRGLDKMHGRNVIHRDLKPDNLVVTMRDDGTTCLKILDFGVAKDVATGGAESSMAIGTPIYMAPEQVGSANIGPHTDRFALAHVAYALLTGEAYWAEEFAAEGMNMITHLFAPIPELPGARAMRRKQMALPPGFDAWFAKATARNHVDRYGSSMQQTDALADALAVDPTATSIGSDTLEAATLGRRSAAALGPMDTPSSPAVPIAAVATPSVQPARPWLKYALAGLGLVAAIAIVLMLTRSTPAPAASATSSASAPIAAANPPAAVPTAPSAAPSAAPAVASATVSAVASASAAPSVAIAPSGKLPVGANPFGRPPTTGTGKGGGDNPWDFKPPK